MNSKPLSSIEIQAQAVLDTILDGVVTIDAQGTMLSANRAAEKIFGYESKEMLGQNVSMLMPAPYRDEHDGYVSAYLQTGEKKIIGIGREVRGRRKDGSIFPMELAVSEVRMGDWRLFTGLVRDISERIKAEQALQRSEEHATHLGKILEDSQNELFVFDAHTLKFLQVNSGAQKNLGFSMAELQELSPLDLETEYSAESFDKLLEPLREGRELKIAFSTKHKRKDGSTYPVEVHLQRSLLGETEVFVAIALDISERHRAEEARQQAERIASARERLALMGELSAGVAHEFRNPLHGVLNCIDLLRPYQYHDDSIPEILDLAEEGLRRMDSISGRLLRLSRPESGQRVPTDLEQVVDGTFAFVQARAGKERIELRKAISPEEPMAYVDGERISEVLLNLLNNSLDASPTDSVITVSIDPDPDSSNTIELRVKDQGSGIPPETAARMFDPFFTTKPIGKGSGLGMALVRKIIENHGGTVMLEETDGPGATILIRLPIADMTEIEENHDES